MRVRYFAAAAEAAGTDAETLDVADLDAATAGAARTLMVQRHGADLQRVLTRCALLVDGQRADADDHPIGPDSTIDVLPPFAGG